MSLLHRAAGQPALPRARRQHARGVFGLRLPHGPGPLRAGNIISDVPGDSSSSSGTTTSTLDSLDSMLGGPSPDAEGEEKLIPLGELWRVRPKQSAPPRTTALSPGNARGGRFLANESLLQSSEIASGRKTLIGQELELPKVTPVLSWLLLAINVGVYGTLVQVSLSQGSLAAAELLGGIGFSPQAFAAASGGGAGVDGVARLLTSSCVPHEASQLALSAAGLALVAPRVETLMGYPTFLCIYLLSGATAAASLVFTQGLVAAAPAAVEAAAAAPDAAAAAAGGGPLAVLLQPAGADAAVLMGGCIGMGATGALFGLLACAVVNEVRNGGVERDARQRGTSTGTSTSTSSSESGTLSLTGRPAAAAQALLLAAAGVALALQGQDAGAGEAPAHAAELAAGFLAGGALAWRMGPRYQVIREATIQEGLMHIPEDVEEMIVVLDATTPGERLFAAACFSVALLAATGLGSLVAGYGH